MSVDRARVWIVRIVAPIAFIAANRATYVRPRRPFHDSLAAFYQARSPYGRELAA